MVGLKKIVATRVSVRCESDSVDQAGGLNALKMQNPAHLLEAIRGQKVAILQPTDDVEKETVLKIFLSNKVLSLSDLFACVRVLQLHVFGDDNRFWKQITTRYKLEKQDVRKLFPLKPEAYKAAIQDDRYAVQALARLMAFCKTSQGREISAEKFFDILDTVTQLVSPERLEGVFAALINKSTAKQTDKNQLSRNFQTDFVKYCIEAKKVSPAAVVRIVGSLQKSAKDIIQNVIETNSQYLLSRSCYCDDSFARVAPFIVVGLSQNHRAFNELRFMPSQVESLTNSVQDLLNVVGFDTETSLRWLLKRAAENLALNGLQQLVEDSSLAFLNNAIPIIHLCGREFNIERVLKLPKFTVVQRRHWGLVVNSNLLNSEQNTHLALKIFAELIIAQDEEETLSFIRDVKLLSQVSLQECVDTLVTLSENACNRVSELLSKHGDTLKAGLSQNHTFVLKPMSENAVQSERLVYDWALGQLHTQTRMNNVDEWIRKIRVEQLAKKETLSASTPGSHATPLRTGTQILANSGALDRQVSLFNTPASQQGVHRMLSPRSSFVGPVASSTPLNATTVSASSANQSKQLVSIRDVQAVITVEYPGHQSNLVFRVGQFKTEFLRLKQQREAFRLSAFQQKSPVERQQEVQAWLQNVQKWVETRTELLNGLRTLAELGQTFADALNKLHHREGTSLLYARYLYMGLREALPAAQSSTNRKEILTFFGGLSEFDASAWFKEEGFVETTGAEAKTWEDVKRLVNEVPIHSLQAQAAEILVEGGLTVLERQLVSQCRPSDSNSLAEQALIADWALVGYSFDFTPALEACFKQWNRTNIQAHIERVFTKFPDNEVYQAFENFNGSNPFTPIQRFILRYLGERGHLMVLGKWDQVPSRDSVVSLRYTGQEWVERLSEENMAFFFGLRSGPILEILAAALPDVDTRADDTTTVPATRSQASSPTQESPITTYLRNHPELWTPELVQYAMQGLAPAMQGRLSAFLGQIRRENFVPKTPAAARSTTPVIPFQPGTRRSSSVASGAQPDSDTEPTATASSLQRASRGSADSEASLSDVVLQASPTIKPRILSRDPGFSTDGLLSAHNTGGENEPRTD